MTGVATGQLVTFSIGASADQTENLFTHIEIYRSRVGEDGPYTEVTGPEWSTPKHSVRVSSALLLGKELKLLVDEKHDVTITFTGSNPISSSTAASQITAQGRGLVRGAVEDDKLVISANSVGAAATLRIVGGDAAVLMGLPLIEPDSVAFGLEARPHIVSGKDSYEFTDPHGDSSYFYKVRFGNDGLNQVSEFSEPFSATDVSAVDGALLITGFLDLVDIQGHPLEDMEIKIRLKSLSTMLSGALVAGTQLSVRTDSAGHAEVSLPRGLEVAVVIAGTNISRDVKVPSDAALTSFNLLDAQFGSDDAFKVQVPELNYAVRRSL